MKIKNIINLTSGIDRTSRINLKNGVDRTSRINLKNGVNRMSRINLKNGVNRMSRINLTSGISRCLGLFSVVLLFAACDYLNVVPDGVATLEMAFNNKANGEKYLSTCYSYIPKYGAQSVNPGIGSGTETWFYTMSGSGFGNSTTFGIANGLQNSNNPLCNFWDGDQGGINLFQALRDCNTLIDNLSDVSRVPDLAMDERQRWIAEGKALKAYYHFYLFQYYGPIPLIRKNFSISASEDEVRVKREKVDEVVSYIVQLLDEAAPDLPLTIQKESSELGRFTQPAALGLKAKVLVLAASPLFNGNASYANFRDFDGQPFFNQELQLKKWKDAALACQQAIEVALSAGHKLYDFRVEETMDLPEEFSYTMNVRGAVTERFNRELIWGVGKSHSADLQQISLPRLETWHPVRDDVVKACLAPTLDLAELFYTNHGVPISEDIEWAESGRYANRYVTETATEADKYFLKEGYTTAKLNFKREPRFYGSLGFDGSSWFGNGRKSVDNMFYIQAKRGQLSGQRSPNLYSITGYFAKKLVNFKTEVPENGSAIFEEYPFPIIRLADLHLMYAEALNESTESEESVPQDVYTHLDLIRKRSGLEGVKDSWTRYSTSPDKPLTKKGMRDIIRQERGIELALEGNRYFDIRRWKLAESEYNKVVRGWNIKEENAEDYYMVTPIYQMKHSQKSYLWPIKQYNILINSNLIQNPGW